MNMKDEKFREFDIDLETADRIAKEYPSLSDSARERMYNMTKKKMNITDNANEEDDISVHVVEKSGRPGWMIFAGMAATVTVIAGCIGGGNYLHLKLNDPDPNVSVTTSATEPAAVTSSVTGSASAKPLVVTVPAFTSPAAVTETAVSSSFTTEVTTDSSATTSVTTDIIPLSDNVRCEQIKLPDEITHYYMAERIADGFGCIAYNVEKQPIYLHIGEDMKTSEAFVLTPPDHGDYDILHYSCVAFDKGGFWAVVLRESHDGPEPEGGRTVNNHDEYEIWDNSRQDHYLLCHYAGDGTLISSVPVNELQNNYDYHYQNNLECVGETLYLSDGKSGRVFKINKETADVSVISEQQNEKGIRKSLCFDRDDKPVLIQKKQNTVPDCTIINEVSIFEFDLTSGSIGQTFYTTDDDWKLDSYSIEGPEFIVRKGCGEYRLFISTGSELIGLRDNGEQELLIDIDSDLVNNGTIIDCLKTQYYRGSIKNIEIIPVDDTRFLGLIDLPGGIIDRPENAPLTYAFRLTPKH